MDMLPEDPIRHINAVVRASNVEFLRARARENDTNISAELRRILREEAGRETQKRKRHNKNSIGWGKH
jgi:hypothetical protein